MPIALTDVYVTRSHKQNCWHLSPCPKTSEPISPFISSNSLKEADEIEVNNGRRDSHDSAIETVEHASMSWKDVSGILDTQMTFHQRFGQVTPSTEYYHCQSHTYPSDGWHDREEVCQGESTGDTEYSPTDGTFPRLLW